MPRVGRPENFRTGGRALRMQVRLQPFTDDEVIEYISQEFTDFVQNLDSGIRNETMYDVATNVVKRAKKNLARAKEESNSLTEINVRSYELENRLEFTWAERDKVIIAPPIDIPYASITDMSGSLFIEPVSSPFLHYYWFRYGKAVRTQRGVNRPGNEYLQEAIRVEASAGKIREALNKQIDYAYKHSDNVTNRGGALGSRRRRSTVTPSERRRNRARS